MLASPEDRKICRTLLRSGRWKKYDGKPVGELVAAVGAQFLGTPFLAHTLERDGEEQVVINLRQMDCFTFVENTVALARLVGEGKTTFDDFVALLRTMRYRFGAPDGYASRLHYFTDWLYDNEGKGIIKDITCEAGGEPVVRTINFMTANRAMYPVLQGEGEFVRLLAVEKACSGRTFHHIPKTKLRNCADRIKNGDILVITTDAEGLDVLHVGIAVHCKRGLHLLHASQRAGKVIVSGETLYRYMDKQKSRLGIIVARVL